MEEGNQRLTVKAEFFYADNGMVESTDPGWLQSAFYMLTGIFDRVGLQKNVQETLGMACRPCRAVRVRSYDAYTWRITGEGRSFKERQREQVLFPEYEKGLAKGSLVTHNKTQHRVAKGGLVSEGGG